jgi:hypothetical protein
MQARTLAKQVAYGRIAIGAALLVMPKPIVGGWLGAVPESPGGRVLSMAFGARDLALGAGTAYALHTGKPARAWLLAGAFCDVVDAVATAASLRSLPSPGAPGTVALASVGTVTSLWTAREIE